MPSGQVTPMDEPTSPKSDGQSLPHATVAAASSWRPAGPDVVQVRGRDLDRGAARRSAAFVAHAVGALERTQRRWF